MWYALEVNGEVIAVEKFEVEPVLMDFDVQFFGTPPEYKTYPVRLEKINVGDMDEG